MLESFAWLQQHQLPASCARSVAKAFGTETRERATSDPYSFITAVPGFKLSHAETLAASLGFNAAAPQRSAAVMHHVLTSAAQSDSAEGLTWHQLQQRSDAKLAELARVYGRPWPVGFSLREGAELLLADGRAVAEEARPAAAAAAGVGPLSSSSSSSSAHHHSHHHHHHQQQQQQQLYEFELVSSGWSDNVLFKLSKLHAAESDVIDFILHMAAACSEAMTGLWQKAGSSSSSRRRRSRSASQSISSSSSSSGATSSSDVTSSSSASYQQLLPPITPQMQQQIAAFEAELSAGQGSEVCLNEGQRHAVALALSLPLLVLTGGPGCGKTLTSQAVARSWLVGEEDMCMAAPTGGQFCVSLLVSTVTKFLVCWACTVHAHGKLLPVGGHCLSDSSRCCPGCLLSAHRRSKLILSTSMVDGVAHLRCCLAAMPLQQRRFDSNCCISVHPLQRLPFSITQSTDQPFRFLLFLLLVLLPLHTTLFNSQAVQRSAFRRSSQAAAMTPTPQPSTAFSATGAARPTAAAASQESLQGLQQQQQQQRLAVVTMSLT
jgi:hypothetical protein